MTYFRNIETGEVIDCEPTYRNGEWEKLTIKAGKAAMMQQARDKLRKMLPPGTTVYCTLRHVSRSGMNRLISLAVVDDGRLVDISYRVAEATGDSYDHNKGAIRVGGCGMDMGFALVYNLGRALYPQGFGIEGERKDGRKIRGSRKVRPHSPADAKLLFNRGVVFRGRNGDTSGWDNDGGYSLRREWH